MEFKQLSGGTGREPVKHRMNRLQSEIDDYRNIMPSIPTGLNRTDRITVQKTQNHDHAARG